MGALSATLDTAIGKPVPRKEDARLLTGRGSFSDDLNLEGQVYAAMVRSPHAHAHIRRIDARDALATPGVIAALSGEDIQADGLKPIPHHPAPLSTPDLVLLNPDGSRFFSDHYLLPARTVRFVGEAVAMVVATSPLGALTGAERVTVDYEVLPAVTRAGAALEAGAPEVWASVPGNLCVDAQVGDARATDEAFARAAHTVRLKTWVQRVTGVPMEPRAAVGAFDAASGVYTLYAGSGGVQRQRQELSTVLDVPLARVRVVARDIGGNFGTRNGFYPEFGLVVWAARRLGRPVKWTCARQESFLSDYGGRDLEVEAELALDAQGRFLGLRGTNRSNLGAHTVSIVPLGKGVGLMPSVYRIAGAHFRARGVLTHTSPTSPYRSAGRPEAMFVIERLIDLAAHEHGFDRVELRRRNLIPSAATPFRNSMGVTYDSGDYAAAMEAALVLGDWQGASVRRAEARRRGRLRGIGVANYVEITSGFPRERAEVKVLPEGRIEVLVGTLSSGQGHETSFAQCVSAWLGVALERIQIVSGDTDQVPVGGGSHSARSMRMAGVVMGKACDAVLSKARRIAAALFEVAEADLDFGGGRFTIQGTDRSRSLFEVAAAARDADALPRDLRGPLAADCDETFRVAGFPYGSHVCEVEIDPETGEVRIVGYAAVDDVGRAINPLIVDGQTHGGIAQGVGQAMLEACHYDPDSGQLLAASFMDYAMPRADGLPFFRTGIMEVPSPTNPLGVRGGGEGGTTPALAVVVNAIVDALAEFGVKHLEMPVTAERVWRAIRGAAGPR